VSKGAYERGSPQSPRFDITRDTSSTTSSSITLALLWAEDPVTADDLGPYTLGNEGAVTLVGLEFPPVPPPADVVGDSGGGSREEPSVIREREYVRSRD